MNLAVNPPVLPMLAKRVGELPPGEGWIFEPKWDGFRTLIFRDGDEIFIQSRDEKPLNRYFPELIDPLKAQLPRRCVLDGEIVIATSEGLEFDTLQMRLHPAASRVNKLAEATPASIVFFDLLCDLRHQRILIRTGASGSFQQLLILLVRQIVHEQSYSLESHSHVTFISKARQLMGQISLRHRCIDDYQIHIRKSASEIFPIVCARSRDSKCLSLVNTIRAWRFGLRESSHQKLIGPFLKIFGDTKRLSVFPQKRLYLYEVFKLKMIDNSNATYATGKSSRFPLEMNCTGSSRITTPSLAAAVT